MERIKSMLGPAIILFCIIIGGLPGYFYEGPVFTFTGALLSGILGGIFYYMVKIKLFSSSYEQISSYLESQHHANDSAQHHSPESRASNAREAIMGNEIMYPRLPR